MPILKLYFTALLRLLRCGISTANKIVNYFESQNFEINSALELNDLIKTCAKNKIVNNILQYINSEVNEAYITVDKSNETEIHFMPRNYSRYPYKKNMTRVSIYNYSITNPLIIYCRGNLDLLNHKLITIICTRNPMNEGIITSEYIGGCFTLKGFIIICALAQGCDSFVHKGVLKVSGYTTAVLPVAFDLVYPKENFDLAEEIIGKSALLISEYPVGRNHIKYNLVQHKRIVANLCDNGIVIQSSIDGETVLTAKEILKQKNPQYLVKYKSPDIINSAVLKEIYIWKLLEGALNGLGIWMKLLSLDILLSNYKNSNRHILNNKKVSTYE